MEKCWLVVKVGKVAKIFAFLGSSDALLA